MVLIAASAWRLHGIISTGIHDKRNLGIQKFFHIAAPVRHPTEGDEHLSTSLGNSSSLVEMHSRFRHLEIALFVKSDATINDVSSTSVR